jgi:hypothetical protein
MEHTNCPNCGAPITGSCCDYCGTHLEDILKLASGRPVKITFEIGGKGKGFSQIADIPDSYVVNDDVEVGFGNKIPLWLFGFLY